MTERRTADRVPVRIRPAGRRTKVDLREVWQYRDLILLFARKEFALRYKQTILGPLWAFIHPLLSSIVLTVAFSGIVRVDTEGVPHLIFYLVSNSLWSFFSGCLRSNARTFTGNAYLFGKVYFPRLTVPISNMLVSLITFGIQTLITLAFLAFFVLTGQVRPVWALWPLLPLLLLMLGVLGVGGGIIISSLTTKYRDLVLLLDFGVQLLMYISPVVYPVSLLSKPGLRALMLLNPVTMPMEWFRGILLGRGTLDGRYLAASAVLTAAIAILGVRVFTRVERTFMDTV